MYSIDKKRQCSKRYREKNKAKRTAIAKRYYEKHKDKIRAYKKQYDKKHKEEIRAYREKHRDKARAYKKQYRKEHRDRLLALGKKHREQYKSDKKKYDSINKKPCPNCGNLMWKKAKICRNCSKGHNNHAWRGGVAKLNDRIRKSSTYRQWRSDVFTMHDFTCQACGIRGGELNAHHIKAFWKILRENNITSLEDAIKCSELWNINNGQTLCVKCHKIDGRHRRQKERIDADL